MDLSDSSLLARLESLDSGQVSDVLDEAGFPNQVLSAALMPRTSVRRFAGVAACVSGAPIVHTDSVSPRKAFAIDDAATPDSILLVETGGFLAGALVGGFVVRTLMQAGCRGLVTDGSVRDLEEIEALGFPLVARGVTSVNGYRRWAALERGQPIRLPGQGGPDVVVSPGDFVLGDTDGVVVIPANVAPQIIADSEELAAIEGRIGQALQSGLKRSEAFRAHPRFAHIRRLA